MKNCLLFWILSAFSCVAGDTDDFSATVLKEVAIAAEEDAPCLVLSGRLNGLQSGLWIDNTNHLISIANGKVLTNVAFALYNCTSNKISYWTPWPAHETSQYEINVIDPAGKELKKTFDGRAFQEKFPAVPAQTSVLDARSYGLRRSAMLPKSDLLFSLTTINADALLEKSFHWDRTGVYKLHMVHRVFFSYAYQGGVYLKQVSFPEIEVDVSVQTNQP